MSRIGTPILLAPLLLSGCFFPRPLLDDIHRAPYPESLPSLPPGESLDVLVFGDWGTGGPGQRRTARAMEDTYRFDPPDLVLTVGDNFYPSGVQDVDDPLWERVFEKVYRGSFWDSLTFYPILGNHDRYGNALAQIQYRDVNPRWQMAGTHYAFRAPVPGGGSALFVALDTSPLQGEWNASPHQLTWVDSVLGAANDEWVIAYGHHPLASVGWHETDGYFQERLLPLLSGRATVYLAGHNHSLELLPATPDLLQGVCGGGGGRDNPYVVHRSMPAVAAFTNGGWCYLRIYPEALAVELYNREGELRYRYVVPGFGEARRP